MLKHYNLFNTSHPDKKLGIWCVLPSPEVVEVLAIAGFDFVIIDMEHGPISYETAQKMVMAAENNDCTPLIRVPHDDFDVIQSALDCGAHGIVVPGIETTTQVQLIVQVAKYGPMGVRGFSPYTRAASYGMRDMATYHSNENKNTSVTLIIESQEGVKNIDDIIKIPGVDSIYIGVYDLAQSMGYSDDIKHSEVKEMVSNAVDTVHETNLQIGTLVTSCGTIQDMFERFDFLCYKADCAILADYAKEVIKYQVKENM